MKDIEYGFKFRRSLRPEERTRIESLLNYSEADIETIKNEKSVKILWIEKSITEEELRRYYTIEGIDQQARDSRLPDCLIYYIVVQYGRVLFKSTCTTLAIEKYVEE